MISDAIAVLIAGSPKDKFYDLLQHQTLPNPTRWSREEHFQDNSVLIDTVKRFKGLERDVIFLWLDSNSIADDALMYVGISRTKTVLYLIGDKTTIDSFELNYTK